MSHHHWIVLLLTLLPATFVAAAEVNLAVAANFTAAMRTIAQQFEQQSGHQTRISYGSTGKLYSQILQNAPFDLFLAADQQRPLLLEQQGLASGRFTYATGRLVLWSARGGQILSANTLQQGDFRRLALANPKTAPYGRAAAQVIEALGLSATLRPKQVLGDSIAQTYQFVATGNAEIGFIAQAQVALDPAGSQWPVPSQLHQPIHQDMVLLERGQDNPAAVALMAFMQSPAAQVIIRHYGYQVTTATP